MLYFIFYFTLKTYFKTLFIPLKDRFMPPDQRCNYHCDRDATGPVDRKQLIEHINKIAIETPDKPDPVPFVAGVVRGKKVRTNISYLSPSACDIFWLKLKS